MTKAKVGTPVVHVEDLLPYQEGWKGRYAYLIVWICKEATDRVGKPSSDKLEPTQLPAYFFYQEKEARISPTDTGDSVRFDLDYEDEHKFIATHELRAEGISRWRALVYKRKEPLSEAKQAQVDLLKETLDWIPNAGADIRARITSAIFKLEN